MRVFVLAVVLLAALAESASGQTPVRTISVPVAGQENFDQLLVSPDSKLFIARGRSKTRIWDIATGEEQKSSYPGVFNDHVAISPDGKFFAVDARIHEFPKYDRNKPVFSFDHGSPHFCNEDKELIVFREASITRFKWDQPEGKNVAYKIQNDGMSYFRAISRDGKLLLYTSGRKQKGSEYAERTGYAIADALTGKTLKELSLETVPDDGYLNSPRFLADGKTILMRGQAGFWFWNWEENTGAFRAMPAASAVVSPDGKIAILIGGERSIFGLIDIEKRKLVAFDERPKTSKNLYNSAIFTPNGKHVITKEQPLYRKNGEENQTLFRVWETEKLVEHFTKRAADK